MTSARFYVVTGRSGANRFTYNCPTPDWALRKLRDFRAAGRSDIAVAGPDGTAMTEDDLVRIAGEGVSPAMPLRSEPVTTA